MRVLRISMYPPPGVGTPTTMGMRAADARVSLEEAEERNRELHPEMFTVTEIFAVPDGSVESATREIARRWHDRRETESRMAELFYWIASRIGPFKQRMTDPSKRPVIRVTAALPLSAEEIAYVFSQLARYPDCTPDVRVEMHSHKSGTTVALDNGVVTIGPGSPPGGRGRYHGPN